MFNGYINLTDALILLEKIRKGYLKRILSRLGKSRTGKIQEAWKPFETPVRFWLDIPYVQRRNNRMQSGNPDHDIYRYVADTYLSGKKDLVALSLCCGTGEHEKKWAATGAFKRIHAIDLSPNCIQEAIASVNGKSFEHVLDFKRSDVWDIKASESEYDVIFSLSAFHHITPLHQFICNVKKWLKPGGLLIVWDFFGPTRFQWTNRQLEVISGILSILPESYRKQWNSGTIKRKAYRPGKLMMILNDPSEAVESSKIRPLLESEFTIVEEKPLAGTILQLLLDDIALNFLKEDELTKRYLDFCFIAEDLFLEEINQQSDLVFGVYTK